MAADKRSEMQRALNIRNLPDPAASQGEAERGGEALEAVAKARRSLEHSRLFATQQHSTRERQEMARDVIDRVEQAFAAFEAREALWRRMPQSWEAK